MQAVPEPRQQTFEEIYGPPENFLEIEVCCASIPAYRHRDIGSLAIYQKTTSSVPFLFPLVKKLILLN